MSSFGEDYGSYCAAWEDGACSASIDYNKCINGPGHTCGNKKGCHDLWPDYNFNTDQIWLARFHRRLACNLRLRVCVWAAGAQNSAPLSLAHDRQSAMQVL